MRETLEQLKELLGADFGELVSAFDIDNRQHLSNLRQAIVESDSDTVAREAHSIKGASSNLGALELAEKCQLLESAGKANDLSGAEELLDQIEQLFEQAVSIIRSV